MDAFNVKGPDGITRSLSEHYDGMKDVEQDPYGAWLAIQNQATRIEALEAQVKAADALAEAIRRTGYRVDHTGVTTLTGIDAMIPINDALAAYRAAKAGGA